MSSSGIGFPRSSTKDSTDTGRYRRKVGFEAFEAGPEALFAYTCQVSGCRVIVYEHRLTGCQAKSEGYKRSRNTRVFAVAVSDNEAGEDALEWLMSELVEDGDEIVAIRVIELDEDGRYHIILIRVLGLMDDRTSRSTPAGRIPSTGPRAITRRA
jgi:hypothetical protein